MMETKGLSLLSKTFRVQEKGRTLPSAHVQQTPAGSQRQRARVPPEKMVRRTCETFQTLQFPSTLEATQRQIDGCFSQLSYKCNQNRVESVGD